MRNLWPVSSPLLSAEDRLQLGKLLRHHVLSMSIYCDSGGTINDVAASLSQNTPDVYDSDGQSP